MKWGGWLNDYKTKYALSFRRLERIKEKIGALEQERNTTLRDLEIFKSEHRKREPTRTDQPSVFSGMNTTAVEEFYNRQIWAIKRRR